MVVMLIQRKVLLFFLFLALNSVSSLQSELLLRSRIFSDSFRRGTESVSFPSSVLTPTTRCVGGWRVGAAHRLVSRQTRLVTVSSSSSSSSSSPDRVVPVGSGSITTEVFNLVKSIVGAGVLGLPAGIAAFGDAPTAVLPAMMLLAAIGCLSGYGFYMIGSVCDKTNSTSYRQAWSRSVGERSSWLPAAACSLVCFCSVLTYSMILADTIPAISQAMTSFTLSRTHAILGITGTALLPLCLMKQLSSLAPFSLIGIIGMLYTAAIMMFRWLTKSYLPPDGAFFLTGGLAPNRVPRFGSAGAKAVFSGNAAILVSMLATSFMAHYNAPKFFRELRNKTLPRFQVVVTLSFMGAVLLMAMIAAAGFGTFGAASSSLILNNYSISDSLMSVSRVAVTLSLIFSYPLVFVGVRENLFDLLQVPQDKRDRWSDPLTVALLTVITGLAFVLKDIRIILAFGGATWGNALIYIFPSLMLVHAARNHSELQKQVPRAVGTGLLGLLLGVIGTVRALSI